MTNPVEKKHYAENGMVHENGTTAIAGSFYEIYVYAAATFSLLTMPKTTGDVMTSIAFPAGTRIKGPITAFTLASGGVFAYKNEPTL